MLSLSNKLRLFAESYGANFPPNAQALRFDGGEKVIVAEMLLQAADELENPKEAPARRGRPPKELEPASPLSAS